MHFHTFVTKVSRKVQMVVGALVLAGTLLGVPGGLAHAATSWSESQQGKSCVNLPNENQPGVYLYEDSNYGGQCSYFFPNDAGFGQYNVDALNLGVGNDSASSIRIVNNTLTPSDVTLYENNNQQGPFIIFDRDMSTFTQLRFNDGKNLNDNVSSIQIRYAHVQGSSCVDVPNTTPGVYLYSDINYGGQCSYFFPNGTAFEQFNADALNRGVGNDTASSIRIVNPTSAPWVVTVYENDKQQGPFIMFDRDLSTFLPTRFNDLTNLNDNVSSIAIQWQ